MDRLAEGEAYTVPVLNHSLLRQAKGRNEKDYSWSSSVYRYGGCNFTLGSGFVPGAVSALGASFGPSSDG